MEIKKSLDELRLYLKIVKQIPNETTWNKYAKTQGLLCSKSIEYKYGKKFNKMCRELYKNKNNF